MYAGARSEVRSIRDDGGTVTYLIENGDARLPMWVPGSVLALHQQTKLTQIFHRRLPAVLVVDAFLRDPDEVRRVALAQEYGSDVRYYKGLRSRQRFLWPGLREEFSRLLGIEVSEWLGHSANGVFQQTSHGDPLVYHHDQQQFAAAIYLTPDGPVSGGTSFWRDRASGCRRAPDHPFEVERLGSTAAVDAARSQVYNQDHIVGSDNWELVESVAGLYNRLVIWDAKLIHSATSYESFAAASDVSTRVVQLFFFDAG